MHTLRKLRDLLCSASTFNWEIFERDSYKTPEELLEEIDTRDVRVENIDDVICRMAYNVRALVTSGTNHVHYVEYKRRFRNGKQLKALKLDTVSETRKPDETPIKAIVRCFQEEVDVDVDPAMFRLLPYAGNKYRPLVSEHTFSHPSSVYKGGIRSIVTTIRYGIHFPEAPPRLSKKINELPDNGSTLWVARID